MIHAVAAPVQTNYLNEKQGPLSWFLTTDHKRIGILYTASITCFFFIGGFFALLMRLNLLTPHSQLVDSETYNKLFTMHGIIMVWFFLIPSIPNTLGNFLIPDDDRGEGSGVSQAQSGELVHLHAGRRGDALRVGPRRR